MWGWQGFGAGVEFQGSVHERASAGLVALVKASFRRLSSSWKAERSIVGKIDRAPDGGCKGRRHTTGTRALLTEEQGRYFQCRPQKLPAGLLSGGCQAGS